MVIYNELNTAEREKYDKFYEENADNCQEKLGFELGDLSIYCGANVIPNTETAMRQALAMVDSGIFTKVLIVNTCIKSRRVLKLAREVSPDGRIGGYLTKNPVCLVSAVGGKLGKSFPEIFKQMKEYGFDAVIINSWEAASLNHHFKEELVFRIRSLTETNELTTIVYTHSNPKEAVPGTTIRGGLGKLGLITSSIISLAHQQEIENEKKKIDAEKPKEEITEHFISEEGKLAVKQKPHQKKKRDYIPDAPPIATKEEVIKEILEE